MASSRIKRVRVPLAEPNPMVESDTVIQVNHCRMPDCDNYGVHARTTPVKTGRSDNRDPHYKVSSTAKGRVSALVCKCCKESVFNDGVFIIWSNCAYSTQLG